MNWENSPYSYMSVLMYSIYLTYDSIPVTQIKVDFDLKKKNLHYKKVWRVV